MPEPSLAALPAAVSVLAGQSDRRRLPSIDYLRRALELADRYDFVRRVGRVLQRDLSRRGAALRPDCCRRRSRPATASSNAASCFTACRSARACPGCAPDSSPAMPRLIKAFLLVSHLSRLRDAAAHAAREHPGLGRRRARRSRIAGSYRQKFAAVLPILREVLDVEAPDASFYLWPRVARRRALHARTVRAPARDGAAGQLHRARHRRRAIPGRGRVRISLVANVPECIEAAERIRDYVRGPGRSS